MQKLAAPRGGAAEAQRALQFTCFTSTKVQILTQEHATALRGGTAEAHRALQKGRGRAALAPAL
jgi:hypothetical protein